MESQVLDFLQITLLSTALLSCLFCLAMVIIYFISYDKENNSYNNLIIALGICDFLFSFCKF